MFENITFDAILERMLEEAKKSNPLIDTREGSVVYQAVAAAALEIMNMLFSINNVYQETFADTASRDYLILRAKERGITPTPATKAVLKGMFTPSTLAIPIGSRFSLDKLNYTVVEKIADGQYKVECETYGEEGNHYVGTLIPIDYIDGLETAAITEVLVLGEDEEDTESIRKRYMSTLSAEAYGGNKQDYKQKVSLINGVGGVKVYSGTEWNGGGTVKIVVTDSAYGKPTSVLIDNVQKLLDPLENTGEGVGIAPIGHIVTVVGVNEEIIDISSQITYQSGYDWDSVKAGAEEAIDGYFKEINADWANHDTIVVRTSYIEQRLLGVQGILDVRGTTINGFEENWECEKDSIAKRGTVNE